MFKVFFDRFLIDYDVKNSSHNVVFTVKLLRKLNSFVLCIRTKIFNGKQLQTMLIAFIIYLRKTRVKLRSKKLINVLFIINLECEWPNNKLVIFQTTSYGLKLERSDVASGRFIHNKHFYW